MLSLVGMEGAVDNVTAEDVASEFVRLRKLLDQLAQAVLEARLLRTELLAATDQHA
jgi:hypothetical protein